MKIRKMQASDCENVLNVWRDVFGEKPTQAKDYLLKFLNRNPSFCFVAEEDEKIVGVTLASFNERVGYINRIAVKKNLQGQGIAKELVKATVEALKNSGAPSVFIHCKPELTVLYEKLGFKIDKDSVIMRLKLD